MLVRMRCLVLQSSREERKGGESFPETPDDQLEMDTQPAGQEVAEIIKLT